MSPSLESGVRRRMESPTEGEEVTLLVKVTEPSDSTIRTVEETGAHVEESLPLNYLAVSTTEERLDALCELDSVARVEIESQGSVMSSDFRIPTGSVL